jgi:hypothetical protein
MEWISTKEKLPTLNEEYLVVWNLQDNEHPVVTSMDFDVKRKCFTDPRGTGNPVEGILFWGELPEPPKNDKKEYFIVAEQRIRTLDQMERLAYGQCIHGENLASCEICNGIGTTIYGK